MALFTVAEIVAATGGQAIDLTASEISSISIDSRDLEVGALFVAIVGDRFDGHDFARAAIENGAVVALVSEARAEELSGLPLIVVADALAGLGALARVARARSNAQIVAVTGSVGKTSTKEVIAAALRTAGKTHAAVRSFNNHWGVPLTLARLPQDAEFAVFEIGMSNVGEITPLVDMVAPDIAVVTSIAAAHLEFLGSMEGIAAAKAEVFSGLKPGGAAIINADHDYLEILTSAAEQAGAAVMTYGYVVGSSAHIEALMTDGSHMRATLVWPDARHGLHISVIGRHHLANAAAAMCVARVLGLDLDAAEAAIVEVGALVGRGAVVRLGPVERPLTLVDESFNANPASMAAALSTFARMRVPDGRKVLILGDMLELGDVGAALHEQLAPAVTACAADAVFLVGEQMAALGAVLGTKVVTAHAQKVGEMEKLALSGLDYGDIVMVKGSKGVRLDVMISRIHDRFGPVK